MHPPRQPAAALFDIDGTLTSDNVWKGVMAFFKQRNERQWTHRGFLMLHYPLVFLRPLHLLSEARFRSLWASHLPWYFRGYSEEQMTTMAEWVAREFVAHTQRDDILEKLREHLSRGDVVALVSGAPMPVAQAIARMWDVPHAVGSPAELQDGRYRGRLAGAPCIDEHKAVYARRYFADQRLTLDFSASYAYADSYSDLGLFEMVGHPVAVYPDQKLRALALERGWEVLDGRKQLA
jgi:HAD superfamily hydrolase (TIGR01490 family)